MLFVVNGDVATGTVSSTAVVDISTSTSAGVYNVHTLHGSIVVNDVVASHFTTESSWGPTTRNYASVWYVRASIVMFAVSGYLLSHGAFHMDTATPHHTIVSHRDEATPADFTNI